MLIGTVTPDRKPVYPVKIEETRQQNVFTDGQGNVRVRDRGVAEKFVTYKFKGLSKISLLALETYLVDVAKYKLNQVLVIDDVGNGGMMRWWDNKFTYSIRMGGRYDLDLKFRVE